jgi:hypothetical protein
VQILVPVHDVKAGGLRIAVFIDGVQDKIREVRSRIWIDEINKLLFLIRYSAITPKSPRYEDNIQRYYKKLSL